MKYRAAIFDMDGTLLDTLEDLADSVNAMLKQYDYPTRTTEEIRTFVGNGARNLIAGAVPAGTAPKRIDECLSAYLAIYEKNMSNKTRPYPGIPELLEKLKLSGMKTAVCSNKGDFNVKNLCEEYFPDLVDTAAGEMPGIRRKPAPDSVLKVLRELNVSPQDAVYIGDSEVDVLTAKNAGLAFIGVTWGFRSRETLLAEGASVIVDTADELLQHLI
ncbi:MAG: HAD family hydrolase [Clostridiales bacterium]|nr:HAD family hydrolase [Clostridiales bacterium]